MQYSFGRGYLTAWVTFMQHSFGKGYLTAWVTFMQYSFGKGYLTAWVTFMQYSFGKGYLTAWVTIKINWLLQYWSGIFSTCISRRTFPQLNISDKYHNMIYSSTRKHLNKRRILKNILKMSDRKLKYVWRNRKQY